MNLCRGAVITLSLFASVVACEVGWDEVVCAKQLQSFPCSFLHFCKPHANTFDSGVLAGASVRAIHDDQAMQMLFDILC
jgi:hypothetical protein